MESWTGNRDYIGNLTLGVVHRLQILTGVQVQDDITAKTVPI